MKNVDKVKKIEFWIVAISMLWIVILRRVSQIPVYVVLMSGVLMIFITRKIKDWIISGFGMATGIVIFISSFLQLQTIAEEYYFAGIIDCIIGVMFFVFYMVYGFMVYKDIGR